MYHGGAWLDDLHIHARVRPYGNIDYNLGLRREVLDRILIDHAARQPNITIRMAFNVTGLEQHGNTVIGVRGRQNGGSEELLLADVVVGADGVNSQVARVTKPRSYNRHPGQNAPYFAYYRNFRRHEPAQSISYRGSGFGVLVFPADDGLTAISVGVRKERWPSMKANANEEFERIWRSIPELADRGKHAVRSTPVKGQGPRPSLYRVPWGPGWALVGDAGFMKDPVAGQGIHDALRSAELFAASWQQWRTGSDWSTAMRVYQRTRDRESKQIYKLTVQSGKLPRRQALNWLERIIMRTLEADSDFASRFTGVYNGASDPDHYLGVRGGIELVARALVRPIALRLATASLLR
ncbi:MAG: hypothetical protein NVSMB42_27130 [Herpetosiphon sp.]